MEKMCEKCGKPTHDTCYGNWCDACGGVATKSSLTFRHVATVDGPGGRLAIVWDTCMLRYKFIYPNKVNPNAEARTDFGEFHAPKLLTAHGPLESLLMIAHREVSPDGSAPELSAAPSSTPEERALMGI
jgi:hypothetical protein